MSGEAKETPQVIIVEDNVSTNNLLRDWLKLQFRVLCFLDAESTLRLLSPTEETIVFVIDYNMPGDDGVTLKQKLAPKFPNAKYILISGLFDSALLVMAQAAQFDLTLAKPFTLPTLTKSVSNLLGIAEESLLDKVKER